MAERVASLREIRSGSQVNYYTPSQYLTGLTSCPSIQHPDSTETHTQGRATVKHALNSPLFHSQTHSQHTPTAESANDSIAHIVKRICKSTIPFVITTECMIIWPQRDFPWMHLISLARQCELHVMWQHWFIIKPVLKYTNEWNSAPWSMSDFSTNSESVLWAKI